MTLLAQALSEARGSADTLNAQKRAYQANALTLGEPRQVVEFIDGMPSVDAVRALEALALTLPQVAIDPITLTYGKVSARAGLIPKGTVLTGALTNLDNVCIVLGDITVTTDDGPRRLTGFHMLPAMRGAKRVGEAHADTLWVTVHHTQLTDQLAIEDEMTGESHCLWTRRNAERGA